MQGQIGIAVGEKMAQSGEQWASEADAGHLCAHSIKESHTPEVPRDGDP